MGKVDTALYRAPLLVVHVKNARVAIMAQSKERQHVRLAQTAHITGTLSDS